MLGLLMLIVFECSGVAIMDALLRRQGRMTRLWLGLSAGMLLLMWLPSLYAFRMDFTLRAQRCAMYTAVSLALLSQLASRAVLFRGVTGPVSTRKEPPVWLVLALVIPALVVMAVLQYTHTLRPVDGALYTGQSTYGDLNMHLGFATGLVDAHYPPEYTILPGTRLGYPFLVDALSSSLYIMGLPLRWAFILPGTLMSGLVFWGFILFAWRFTRDKRAIVLSFLLMFLNGGFGFFYVLDKVGADPSRLISALTDYYKAPANLVDENIRWVNVIVDMMLPQRTLMAGWAMVLPALWLLYEAVSSRRALWYFVLVGIWGGTMPMVHTHSFLALGLISAGLMVYSLLKTTGARRKGLFIGYVVYGLLAVLLALPQLFMWTFPQTVKGGSLRFQFNWVNWNGQGLIDGYFWFWIKNIGPVFLFLLPGALFAKPRNRGFAIGAGIIWIVAELILFQPNVYDNNKLFYVAYMTLLPMAADYLLAIYDRLKGMPLRRVLAAAFVLVSTLAGILSVAREVYSNYGLYDAAAVASAEWIQENAPQDAVFLTADNHNNTVAALTGRKIVCGSGSYLYYHGVDYAEQANAERFMFEYPLEAEALFRRYGVDYIYISSYERSRFTVDYEGIAGSWPLVYSRDGVDIYAVSERAQEGEELEHER